MTPITISQRDWRKKQRSEPKRQKLGTIPGSSRSMQSYILTYYWTPLQLSPRPLQFSQLWRWGGPALRVLDFGQKVCRCTQFSNSNSPLACVIWRCITMRRHLSSKSSSSFAFFRQSRMSGSVDVGSQCFCRIKPGHYRCTDKTSYGKLQTSEINTQPQTWTLAWRSGAVEGAGGRQLGSVSDDTKRPIQHGRSTYPDHLLAGMHQSIICDCELVFLQREWTQHMNWQHASNHQMPHLPYCFKVKKPFDLRKWILLTACISLKLSHLHAMSEKDEIQSRITWKWSKYCLMFDKGKVSTTGKTQNRKLKIRVKQIKKTNCS